MHNPRLRNVGMPEPKFLSSLFQDQSLKVLSKCNGHFKDVTVAKIQYIRYKIEMLREQFELATKKNSFRRNDMRKYGIQTGDRLGSS